MVDSKQQWKAWLYLLPAIILLLIFTAWPIVNTLRMAFTVRWDPELPVEYEIVEEVITIMDENGDEIEVVNKKEIPVKWGGYTTYKISESISGDYDYEFGLANFKAVINYDGFWLIMQNTVLLCVLTVPLSTFLALLIAVCLNAIKPLRRLLQTIFFLPYVTNSIAIGMVFAAMFNIVGVNTGDIAASTSVGIINTVIGWFGMDPINWINQGSTYWANMLVMIIYIVWNALPFKILILLGGLQSVNKQYYDAAKIDSTPKWRVFTRITVPLLSPMIAYVVITGFIGGFKEYTSIVGIFGEGMQPPGASVGTPRLQTMVGYIYDNLGNAEGIASAAALLLFLLIFAVTLVNLAVSKKKTHY
ncbi:MAG: sugar ABC transporter permease [Clostridia bacterium]|nr:sugar ABC transporter permease [Clostridia bacterium]